MDNVQNWYSYIPSSQAYRSYGTLFSYWLTALQIVLCRFFEICTGKQINYATTLVSMLYVGYTIFHTERKPYVKWIYDYLYLHRPSYFGHRYYAVIITHCLCSASTRFKLRPNFINLCHFLRRNIKRPPSSVSFVIVLSTSYSLCRHAVIDWIRRI
jgi:hypothetical protein